jgi:hypothetical protein
VNLKREKKIKLVEVAAFFPLLRLLIKSEHFVNDFYVRQQHSPATVPLNSQAVQDVASILACADSSGEFFPLVPDEFAAGKTSNGNNQLAFAYL